MSLCQFFTHIPKERSVSISNGQALHIISFDPLTTKDKGTMFHQNIRKQ
jgi:hypothetical protein